MKKALLAPFALLMLIIGLTFLMPTPKASALTVTCQDGNQITVADNASPDAIDQACGNTCMASGSFLGFPTWYKYLDFGTRANDDCAIVGPAEGDGSLDMPQVVLFVALAGVEILLRIASIIALGFVMLGGFRYITSQGEPENTKSARQTITNSLIGLVISVIATGLVAFIASQFTS